MTETSATREPVDRLLGGYLLVSATAFLFPHRAPTWPLFVLVHLGLATLLLSGLPNRIRDRAERRRQSHGRGGGLAVLVDWYPLLLFPFLYWEVPFLLEAVWNGRYLDSLVLGWEESLFGLQPSTWLAPRFDYLVLSEILHGAYLSYYPLIYGPPLVLYLKGRKEAFRAVVFALMLGLTAHYLFYIVFPVQGPRYLFPPPDGALAGGPLYRLAHLVLETGSSRGAAFPSAHAAIAALQTLNTVRYLPRSTWLAALLTVGISVGAVYGGFHYAVDILVGLGVGTALGLAAPALRRRLS